MSPDSSRGGGQTEAPPSDRGVPLTEVESAQNKRQLCGGSQAAIERMIHFGRELQSMSEHLRRECGKNSANKKMLKVRLRRAGREEGGGRRAAGLS